MQPIKKPERVSLVPYTPSIDALLNGYLKFRRALPFQALRLKTTLCCLLSRNFTSPQVFCMNLVPKTNCCPIWGQLQFHPAPSKLPVQTEDKTYWYLAPFPLQHLGGWETQEWVHQYRQNKADICTKNVKIVVCKDHCNNIRHEKLSIWKQYEATVLVPWREDDKTDERIVQGVIQLAKDSTKTDKMIGNESKNAEAYSKKEKISLCVADENLCAAKDEIDFFQTCYRQWMIYIHSQYYIHYAVYKAGKYFCILSHVSWKLFN